MGLMKSFCQFKFCKMIRFGFLVVLFGCTLGGCVPLLETGSYFDGRIVGGVPTTIAKHPHQVSLQTTYGGHFCGGSIIAKDVIVTAAHCVIWKTVSDIKIRLGSTSHMKGGVLVAAKALKYHEYYDRLSYHNDVAIIKLSHPVSESLSIRYIKLANVTPKNGTLAVVTGWGVLEQGGLYLPTNLQEIEINIIGRKECSSTSYKYGSTITSTMICAYGDGIDACQADSGGPLVANNKLVGIVSWGNGCAKRGYPGVYTDVAEVKEWIEKAAAVL